MRQMVGQIIKMRGALWVNAFLYYFSRLWMVGRLVPPTAYAGYRAKKALSAAAVAVRQIIDLCGKPLYLLTFLLLPVILLAGSRPQFAGQEFSLFLSMLFFLSCILGAFGDSHIFNVTREKVAFLKYLHAEAIFRLLLRCGMCRFSPIIFPSFCWLHGFSARRCGRARPPGFCWRLSA